MTLDPGTVAVLSFFMGVATVFSPCSLGLLPGYIGHFLLLKIAKPGEGSKTWHRVRQGLLLGLAASSGILVLMLLAALLLRHLSARIQGTFMAWASILIALGLITLGLLQLVGRLQWRSPRWLNQLSPQRSVFVFGLAYALASLGCSLPLLVGPVLTPLLTMDWDAAANALTFFALGIASCMIGVTLATVLAREATQEFLRPAVRWIPRFSGILLVAGGAYVIYYWRDYFPGG